MSLTEAQLRQRSNAGKAPRRGGIPYRPRVLKHAIIVRVDDYLMEHIERLVVEHKCSTAEAARTLMEWGLTDV